MEFMRSHTASIYLRSTRFRNSWVQGERRADVAILWVYLNRDHVVNSPTRLPSTSPGVIPVYVYNVTRVDAFSASSYLPPCRFLVRSFVLVTPIRYRVNDSVIRPLLHGRSQGGTRIYVNWWIVSPEVLSYLELNFRGAVPED